MRLRTLVVLGGAGADRRRCGPVAAPPRRTPPPPVQLGLADGALATLDAADRRARRASESSPPGSRRQLEGG